MNPFLKSPSDRRRATVRAEIPEPRESDGAAVLRLYDPIDSWGGDWGVSAKEFVKALDSLGDVEEIRLHINSPGGEVWDGLAILNALRAHPARVTAVVEGIAASAASFIACGVDRLVMARNAELMIHKAWGMALGNSDDMAKLSADLLHEDRNIASIYAEKSGGDVDGWLSTMRDETWFSAEEAIAAGLADATESPIGGGAAEARNRFDLSIFASTPKNSLPAADGLSTHTPPAVPEDHQEGDATVSDALMTALAQRLGVNAPVDELDEDKLLEALDEALSEQEEGSKPAAPELPEGTVVVDAAALESLKADAAAGRDARNELDRRRREGVVDSAVKAGKITPADRAGWIDRINKPGAEEVITDVINVLQPVFTVSEAGFTGGAESHNDNDEAALVKAAGWEN